MRTGLDHGLLNWDTNDEYHFSNVEMNIGALANRVLSSGGSTDGSLTGPVGRLSFQFFEFSWESEDPDSMYPSLTFTLEGEFLEDSGNGDVPEPSSIALIGAGLMGLGLGRRSRRRR